MTRPDAPATVFDPTSGVPIISGTDLHGQVRTLICDNTGALIVSVGSPVLSDIQTSSNASNYSAGAAITASLVAGGGLEFQFIKGFVATVDPKSTLLLSITGLLGGSLQIYVSGTLVVDFGVGLRAVNTSTPITLSLPAGRGPQSIAAWGFTQPSSII
jgi:hypothetical protein